MRRSLVIAASTIAIVTLGVGPALAHDRPSGTKAAKAKSIQLRCRPEAGPPASVLCEWTAPRREGSFRYELFRKVLGSEGRPAVVTTRTDPDRQFRDSDVAGGSRYAYKVRAADEDGKPAARSRVVVVRCCDQRPGRGDGENEPEATDKRRPKPKDRFEPGARPKPKDRFEPGTRPKPREDRRGARSNMVEAPCCP